MCRGEVSLVSRGTAVPRHSRVAMSLDGNCQMHTAGEVHIAGVFLRIVCLRHVVLLMLGVATVDSHVAVLRGSPG